MKNLVQIGKRPLLEVSDYKGKCDTCGEDIQIDGHIAFLFIGQNENQYVCVSEEVFICPHCEKQITFLLLDKSDEFEKAIHES